MIASAAIESAKWLIQDQRRLLREGFDESPCFTRELYLPTYHGMHVGRVSTFRRRRVFFCCEPRYFDAILTASDDQVSHGTAYSFLKPYFGDQSVFVLDGQGHTEAKRSVYALIREHMDVEKDEIRLIQTSIKRYFRVGVQPVFPALQRVLCGLLIWTVFGETARDEVVDDAIEAANAASGTLLFLPHLLRWTKRFGAGNRIGRLRRNLRRFVTAFVADQDIVHHWGGPPLSQSRRRRFIRDNLLTLLIAGFETTAATVSWLLFELARNTEIQKSLSAEIDSRTSSPVELLAYLEDDTTLLAACAWEALRLHPAIPFVIREAATNFTLFGREIRTGDYLLLSIEEMQRRFFGTTSTEFDPSRYGSRRELPKLASLGGGRKFCPGRAVAVQQIRALATLLLKEFEFKTCSQTVARPIRNRVSAAPKRGMMLKLAPVGRSGEARAASPTPTPLRRTASA